MQNFQVFIKYFMPANKVDLLINHKNTTSMQALATEDIGLKFGALKFETTSRRSDAEKRFGLKTRSRH